MKKYRVTCLKCEDNDVLTIDDDNHVLMYNHKVMLSNILSARWRGDKRWGFQCRCGNDNRLAAKEAGQFDQLVQGDAVSVKHIRDSLKIPDEQQFAMEVA